MRQGIYLANLKRGKPNPLSIKVKIYFWQLLSKDNKQRLLKLAVQIVTNELNENEILTESWCLVFHQVVGQVDFAYV